MQRTVDESLADVDAILFVLDGTEPIGGGDRFVAERVFAIGTPVVVAAEQGRPAQARPPSAPRSSASPSSATSRRCSRSRAKRRDGVDRVGDELLALCAGGPGRTSVDAVDLGRPGALRIGELVREPALNRTREEVPHSIAAVTEEIEPPTRASAPGASTSRSRSRASRSGAS